MGVSGQCHAPTSTGTLFNLNSSVPTYLMPLPEMLYLVGTCFTLSYTCMVSVLQNGVSVYIIMFLRATFLKTQTLVMCQRTKLGNVPSHQATVLSS
jgi:hypothetical protein